MEYLDKKPLPTSALLAVPLPHRSMHTTDRRQVLISLDNRESLSLSALEEHAQFCSRVAPWHRRNQRRTWGTNLTGTGGGLGPSPAPHCKPHRAPALPGDGGTPAAPTSNSSGLSPCCVCWSSQATKEDSGGPGATSHTQARSRTSKDARLRMGTCREKTAVRAEKISCLRTTRAVSEGTLCRRGRF